MGKKTLKTILEMGTYEMRLIIPEAAFPGEIRLKKCFSIQAPREFVASTYIEYPIMDPLPVEKAIRSLVNSSKLGYENVLLLIPDHSALINLLITPPRYSLKETEESIREDFAPIMQLPPASWHIIHKSIGAWDDDEILLAMAIVKNNLLEAGGVVQRSGLNPYWIDVNYFNVSNLIEDYLTSTDNKGKNICLVHHGNETTSIGIFRDGQLRAFLNRPIGAYDFTKQISKHFHVPDSEADQFKRNEIFFLPESTPEQEGLYNYTVIKTVFSTLLREIFGVVENYLTKFREFNIHEMVLSGGGVNFQNIAVPIATNLNTNVRYIGDLYSLQIDGNSVDLAEKNTLATVCGALLRD